MMQKTPPVHLEKCQNYRPSCQTGLQTYISLSEQLLNQ